MAVRDVQIVSTVVFSLAAWLAVTSSWFNKSAWRSVADAATFGLALRCVLDLQVRSVVAKGEGYLIYFASSQFWSIGGRSRHACHGRQ